VLGAAETVVGLTEAFKPMIEKRGLYAPNAALRQAARRGLTDTPMRVAVKA